MPQPKNTALRLLVPAIVIVVGIGVAWAFFKTARNPPGTMAPATTPNAAAAPTQQPQASPSAPQPGPTAAAANQGNPPAPQAAQTTPAAPPSAPAPSSPTPAATGYHVVPAPSTPAPSVGDLDPKGQYKAQLDFSVVGAGVRTLALTDHYDSIRKEKHEAIQVEVTVPHPDRPADVLVPFAALAIEITPPGGQAVIVPLAGTNAWQAGADKPGHFEALIADDAGTPVLRLTRQYSLAPGALDVVLKQDVTNLSGEALSVRYYETGPIDLPQDALGYGGDKRRVRFGYLLPPNMDPTQAEVIGTDYVLPRASVLGKREQIFKEQVLWPDDKAKHDGFTAVWGGMTNRYFGVAAHPMCDPAATGASKTLAWVDQVSRVVLDGGPGAETLGMRLESKQVTLAPAGKPGAAADFTHGFYAGPLDRSDIGKDTLQKSLGLAGLVVYNFGGPCSFCTFTPVSDALLWILHTLHDRVFHDWSLSIIFLVLIVRSCLHPVTKWSQIRMARFGKQMAAIGPKQKIIQEKFKDDPLKLREETSKLWREEGISPTGFLGCLPMFVQTPVWIALYAALYFSVEMRNQPAFYGLFQHLQPDTWKTWQFLGNLSEADRLLYFGHTVATVPILGQIQSLNVLPVLLAVVFFIQQKYLTPPTAATMTPEQEFQQKMMKWMTVFMFPVFMYNAPSGLAIYFICNSTFAILESKYIRSHMDKYDMLNVEKMKQQRMAKKQVAGGWMSRLQTMAEDKQKEARKRAGLPPGGVRRKP